MPSSSRGTRSARTRSTTSSGSATTSSSSTATARSRTTRRSSPASRASKGARWSLVGHQKGRDIRERTHRNFGMTYPEGYRKAMRAMELADRHRFPVLTLVDTPGAYPGVDGGAARPGRLDRALPAGNGAPGRPDRHLRHRRGRFRRRRGDRRRRPGAHAGERHLLGDLARGLRRNPLAGRRRGEEGRRGIQAGRAALPRARRHRRNRAGAARRRAQRPRRGREAPRRVVEGSLAEVDPQDADERRRARRGKFRAMGIYLD